MSYSGISVREALDKINAARDGWYLPQVQRQYVWGDRQESEEYVCLLLDSILKGYPIGGVVLWQTESAIPYREFVQDYLPGKYAKQVDKGRWGAAKSLVYDGQQRLQTLYSVLRYSFNGRVLFFDLLFDRDASETDETGFEFRDPNFSEGLRYLRMTELVSKSGTQKEKIALEDSVETLWQGDGHLKGLVRKNISDLWDTFVSDDHTKSIAYFSIKSESANEVNEVFRRLNTGGVSLTQLELVLSSIKAKYSDYEERLWLVSDKIKEASGGIEFPASSVLQFFHLMIKNTIRIDEDRLEPHDIDKFEQIINDVAPLTELFVNYFNGLFCINNISIIPRWLSVLPIAAYLTTLNKNRFDYRVRAMDKDRLKTINQYFILSQLCDWNTQTMVNAFSREAIDAAQRNEAFPLEKIKGIASQKARNVSLDTVKLESNRLFALKVLMPSRVFAFNGRGLQIDHIFPVNLEGANDAYRESVDVLWNYQPMPADVNNYKRARHPQEYFKSSDGEKYRNQYDFIPDANDSDWKDYVVFIENRKQKMLAVLKEKYDLECSNAGAS